LQNTKIGFEHEVLYVFVPQVQLFNADGEEETVDAYTKFNIINMSNGGRTVVISFHKRNKAIDYLFRYIGNCHPKLDFLSNAEMILLRDYLSLWGYLSPIYKLARLETNWAGRVESIILFQYLI
jgi:hypothetical protein